MLRIRFQHFKWIRFRIWIQIQGFDDKKLEKKTSEKNLSFVSEIVIYLSPVSLKDAQATEEAFFPALKREHPAFQKINF